MRCPQLCEEGGDGLWWFMLGGDGLKLIYFLIYNENKMKEYKRILSERTFSFLI